MEVVPAVAAPAGEAAEAWARPRGSRAARKMAPSHATRAATGTTAMMASCHAERAEFGFMGLHSFNDWSADPVAVSRRDLRPGAEQGGGCRLKRGGGLAARPVSVINGHRDRGAAGANAASPPRLYQLSCGHITHCRPDGARSREASGPSRRDVGPVTLALTGIARRHARRRDLLGPGAPVRASWPGRNRRHAADPVPGGRGGSPCGTRTGRVPAPAGGQLRIGAGECPVLVAEPHALEELLVGSLRREGERERGYVEPRRRVGDSMS
jgi:hypothetical protein